MSDIDLCICRICNYVYTPTFSFTCTDYYRLRHVSPKFMPAKAPKPKRDKQPFMFKPVVPMSVSEPETTRRSTAKPQLKVPPVVKPKPKRKPDSPERWKPASFVLVWSVVTSISKTFSLFHTAPVFFVGFPPSSLTLCDKVCYCLWPTFFTVCDKDFHYLNVA